MEKYYIAYGSNMDFEQMANRCPDAEFIGTSVIKGYELLFKGSKTGCYATIEENPERKVPILVWRISKSDEENLDRYEGFPTFYYKKNFMVTVDGKTVQAMVYIMDEKRCLGRPSDYYYQKLHNAYEKFGFDFMILKTALKESTVKEDF